MNKYEFVKYIPTPSESYMGIAEIFVMEEFTILFKIIQRKDGSGFFPSPASFKMKKDGVDVFESAFKIDSNKANIALNSYIIKCVKESIEHDENPYHNSPPSQNSVSCLSPGQISVCPSPDQNKEEFDAFPF